nr:hypothetical protein [Nostoc sp. EkiNYC01]
FDSPGFPHISFRGVGGLSGIQSTSLECTPHARTQIETSQIINKTQKITVIANHMVIVVIFTVKLLEVEDLFVY